MKNNGFTLAETLIVLGVVGLIATLTIHSLFIKINTIIKDKKIRVLKSKFIEGLNLYNYHDNGLAKTDYRSTYEFLQGLSKHFKISLICDTNNISNCFYYDEIKYDNNTINIKDIKTPGKINLSGEYFPPAAFMTIDGTSYIVSLRKNCIEDPLIPLKDYSLCLDGFFDYNGKNGPNTMGKDIISMRNASVSECIYKIGEDENAVCIVTAPFTPTLDEARTAAGACQSILNNNGIYEEEGKEYHIPALKKCSHPEADYWLAASIACAKENKKLPDINMLHYIATNIYGQEVKKTGWLNRTTFEPKKLEEINNASITYGFKRRYNFVLWADSESNSSGNAEYWSYYPDYTYWNTSNRRDIELIEAFCIKAE